MTWILTLGSGGSFSQKRWKWCPYTFIKWCNITRQVRTMQLPWKLSLNTLIDLCSKFFVIWHIYFLKLGWNANNVSSFCVSVITLMKVTACSSLIQIMKILTIHEFLSFYVSNDILCSTFKVRNIFYSATISIYCPGPGCPYKKTQLCYLHDFGHCIPLGGIGNQNIFTRRSRKACYAIIM